MIRARDGRLNVVTRGHSARTPGGPAGLDGRDRARRWASLPADGDPRLGRRLAHDHPGDAALLAEKRGPGRAPRGGRRRAAGDRAAAAALAAVVGLARAARARRAAGPPRGRTRRTPSAGPLDTAGRLVAEDLCLLVPAARSGRPAGRAVLGAGSVCFPSHWRLARSSASHRPPSTGRSPTTPTSWRPGRPLPRPAGPRAVGGRRNWTVHDSPELFVPEPVPPPDPPVTADDAGERLWLRSERQALVRLPQHRRRAVHDPDRPGAAGGRGRPALCRRARPSRRGPRGCWPTGAARPSGGRCSGGCVRPPGARTIPEKTAAGRRRACSGEAGAW